MPEKSNSLEAGKVVDDQDQVVREITQTDKLNKRLLSSCLQFVNSDKSLLFNSVMKESQPVSEPINKKILFKNFIMSEGDFSDVPDEIERVIEGGGVNRELSDNENEEDKKPDENKDKEKEKIRKRTGGPRIVLNPARLKGPRGLGIMESFFSDIKLHGKGREREDLNLVMQRLEHWTHRLIPRMQFDDCLKKIEKLGSKKEISNYVKRIRLGMEDDDVPNDVMMEDAPDSPPPIEDPFDQLIGSNTGSTRPATTEITSEQREQILRNRLLAEERRAARIKKAQEMKEMFLATQSKCNDTQGHAEIDQSIDVHSQENSEKSTEIQSGEIPELTSLVIEPESDIRREITDSISEHELETHSHAVVETPEDQNSETDQQSTKGPADNADILDNTSAMVEIHPEVDEESVKSNEFTENVSLPLEADNQYCVTLDKQVDILQKESHKEQLKPHGESDSVNEEMEVCDEETEKIKDGKLLSVNNEGTPLEVKKNNTDRQITNNSENIETEEGEL